MASEESKGDNFGIGGRWVEGEQSKGTFYKYKSKEMVKYTFLVDCKD